MISQCILHLALLALNANDVTKAISNEDVQEWCRPIDVLMSSVGCIMIYNILAMLAVEQHSIVGLKREVSPKAAMLATLMAGIISCGILFWASVIYKDKLHVCQITSTTVCSLISIIILWVAWRICTHVDTTETSFPLKDVSKNKTIVFLTALYVVCVVSSCFNISFGCNQIRCTHEFSTNRIYQIQ